MKKRTIPVLLALAIILSFCLAACNQSEPTAPPATQDPGVTADPGTETEAPKTPGEIDPSLDPVTVGFVASIAGPGGYIGQASVLALEDYIDDLNQRGGFLGHEVRVVTYDYSVDPATEIVSATNRLALNDKAIAILGPTGSIAAVPMAPIANDLKVPVIATAATNRKVTVNGETGEVEPYMFRVCFIDDYQGEALAAFAYEKLGITKVAVLTQNGDAYSQGLTDIFVARYKALGGEIIAQMGYQRNEVEFRAQVTDAHNKGAEALYIPASTYGDAAYVANQAQDLGFKFKYLFNDGVYAQELLDIAGPALEGAYMTNGIVEDDPAFEQYKEEFAKKHPGMSANIYVFYTLDAITLLEWAVNESQSVDPEVLRDTLETATNATCYTEPLTMDPETHNPLNKTVNILQITDSKYTIYDSFKPE